MPSATDSWLVFQAGRGHFDRLLRAGVKIHERQGAILHSQTALIDGVRATVGSTNLDWRSFLHNQELNAVVLGRALGEQVQAMFDQDLAQSDAVKLEEWQRRPLRLCAKELYARAWEYWLWASVVIAFICTAAYRPRLTCARTVLVSNSVR